MDWDPKQYIPGSYIQGKINELFRESFTVEPRGSILDLGCGDGQYSYFLANTYKNDRFLGIDSSQKMIRHANQNWVSNNLSFEVHSIEEFVRPLAFDCILSFWTLHWCDISKSLPNIFQSLKPGGQAYALFSSVTHNSIFQSLAELKKKNLFLEHLSDLIYDNPNYFFQVLGHLNRLPFKKVTMHLETIKIALPDIHFFKSLLLTMPVIKRLHVTLGDVIIDELLCAFQEICQRKYQGELFYETRPIFLQAIK